MDATEMLRYFARLQAISCIDWWQQEPPDEVIEYLFGDDDRRSAARSAAEPAARSEFNALVYECFEGPMRDVGFHP